MPAWFNSRFRMWAYGVIAAVLLLLVFYKLIDPAAVPLWLGLAGAALAIGGTGTAAAVVAKQRSNGTAPD